MPRDGFDLATREALAASALASLDAELLTSLFPGAQPHAVMAGADLIAPASDKPFAYLVVSGILRTYGVSEAGRQSTLRYARQGALLGLPSLFHGPIASVGVQAVVHARVRPLHAANLLRLVKTRIDLAHALLLDQTGLVNEYLETLVGTTTSTLKQNLLRHLLELATFRASDHALVARMSQQKLANHVGTVREVVARILKELRDDNMVTTARDEIVILEPEALARATWPRTF